MQDNGLQNIGQDIQRLIDGAIQTMILDSVKNLAVDPAWLDKVQQQVNVNMVARVVDRMSLVDLDAVVSQQVAASMEKIRQRVTQELRRVGIQDQATEVELSVLPKTVVVENRLVAKNLQVLESTSIDGTLTIRDLVVRGTINTDNRSWDELVERTKKRTLDSINQQWRQDLVQQVLELSRTQGIDFQDVTIDGSALISQGVLSPEIRDSSLVRLGTLKSLEVSGTADLASTLKVNNKRVGINTQNPEMALTIWDDETTVQAGKLSKDKAYIGTARKHDLVIGINRDPAIEIDSQGLVTVGQFRIDRFRISHAADVPGWSGTRGDLVINHDPKPDRAFAWICLGGFRWQPLRSA